MEHHPEVDDGCLLNEEPGDPVFIEFREREPIRIAFTARAKGRHSAQVHAMESAAKVAMAAARGLDELTGAEGDPRRDIASAVDAERSVIDEKKDEGAGALAPRLPLNIGLIQCGKTANAPFDCRFVADLRLPLRVNKADSPRIAEIAARHPGIEGEQVRRDALFQCDQPMRWSASCEATS
ncbi:MAG: hypothetical protein AAFN79_05105 [Pseudomonadota bacterium]